MLAFVFDKRVRDEINRQHENCWEVYIEEILGLMGARARTLSLDDLEDACNLTDLKTLVIGAQSGARLSASAREYLAAWVQRGGTLIGFAVQGLDQVFGIATQGTLAQAPDTYAIAGYFDLLPHPLTKDIHPFLYQEQRLIILSPAQLVAADKDEMVCSLFDAAGNELERAAVTWHRHGEGYAGYFAFDVAKTAWLLHQGRPAPDDREENRYPKVGTMETLGNNSLKVAYADEIVLLLQQMIARHEQPFIYQIPPDGQTIPDALLYWGGDEYEGPTALSLGASDWMRSKGLPYHINMQDNHPITLDELQHILDNGHEVSLYYHLLPEENYVMHEELYLRHAAKFRKRFGIDPVCTLNDSCRWKGWAEPAKWMRKAGGKADNSFGPSPFSYEHPQHNGPFYGSGFGTFYPFFFYDDFTGGNRRIDFIEEPMGCYEIGHRGSIKARMIEHKPFADRETVAFEDLYVPLDQAIRYHRVMNMFYHPTYIVNNAPCRQAIEEILRYLKKKGAPVLHMANNAVAAWWFARAQSKVDDIIAGEESIGFLAETDYADGIIVKMRVEDGVARVTCDGAAATYQIKHEFGSDWLYIIIPAGIHQVKIERAQCPAETR